MKRILGCEIFRREFEHLYPGEEVRPLWLPAGLHADLGKLGVQLETNARPGENQVILFGACHPAIDDLVARNGAVRLPGKDCIAAFLTEKERKELESRKAFLMTPGWLRHWREIFQNALGWDPVDGRANFSFYEVILILDFGLEPLDEMEILGLFEFTGTPIEVIPADLEHFKSQLDAALAGCG